VIFPVNYRSTPFFPESARLCCDLHARKSTDDGAPESFQAGLMFFCLKAKAEIFFSVSST
jgi:hypothetical protein